MTNEEDRINSLNEKLDLLLKRQDTFSKEINSLVSEINALKSKRAASSETESIDSGILSEKIDERNAESLIILKEQEEIINKINESKEEPKKANNKTELERFIGENLINKIGIVITIIGVGIGAKYSIEHELISPSTRIILGYLVGAGLLGFGLKLKKNYENFSAVLVSGAMTIMYFITFFAFSMYHLLGKMPAFGIMVVLTIATVALAIRYNRVIIAHIGLIGAYAVPFLLSDGTGKVETLYTYMSIINIGILSISFIKYWKSLYNASFILTWLVFLTWFILSYSVSIHFTIALTFCTIFFFIFYITFIAYKLVRQEKFMIGDIILLLANSFVFYGIGMLILNSHSEGKHFLGLFTLGNAILHGSFSLFIYVRKLSDRNLFYFVSGMALIFITIAIPVQFDGNWVTLIWAGDAIVLFWIGKTKKVLFYELLSYPMMILAFISLNHEWSTVYGIYNPGEKFPDLKFIFNIHFLTSMIFAGCLGYATFLLQKYRETNGMDWQKNSSIIMRYAIPTLLLFVLHYGLLHEIINYWQQLYKASELTVMIDGQRNYFKNENLLNYRVISTVNYTLLFFALISIINLRKLNQQLLGKVLAGCTAIAILFFLVTGLFTLSELREGYQDQSLKEYYDVSSMNLTVRYFSFVLLAMSIWTLNESIKKYFTDKKFHIGFEFLLHLTIVWVASSELINLMDMSSSDESYKLGISILWGFYSMVLIVLGIWKKKGYLRIGAISLFGVTLIKLFFYDISYLNTISKTIVFVSLGLFLLIISFLYNKYKHSIFGNS